MPRVFLEEGFEENIKISSEDNMKATPEKIMFCSKIFKKGDDVRATLGLVLSLPDIWKQKVLLDVSPCTPSAHFLVGAQIALPSLSGA